MYVLPAQGESGESSDKELSHHEKGVFMVRRQRLGVVLSMLTAPSLGWREAPLLPGMRHADSEGSPCGSGPLAAHFHPH